MNGTHQNQNYAEQGWLHSDARLSMQDSILTPSSGSMYDKPGSGMGGHGQSETSPENNGSPDGDQSSRPTPSSSTASDHKNSMGNGMNDVRGTSFDTGGVMGGPTVLLDAQGTGYLASGREYGLGISGISGRPYVMGDAPDGYGMTPGDWQGMQGQGMPVLRSLVGMEPLDAMDLTIDGRRNDGHGDAQYGSMTFR